MDGLSVFAGAFVTGLFLLSCAGCYHMGKNVREREAIRAGLAEMIDDPLSKQKRFEWIPPQKKVSTESHAPEG